MCNYPFAPVLRGEGGRRPDEGKERKLAFELLFGQIVESRAAPHHPLSPEYRGESKECGVSLIFCGWPLRGRFFGLAVRFCTPSTQSHHHASRGSSAAGVERDRSLSSEPVFSNSIDFLLTSDAGATWTPPLTPATTCLPLIRR